LWLRVVVAVVVDEALVVVLVVFVLELLLPLQ
jgi:hypothetical protein